MLQRLKITSYMGIAAQEIEFAPAGAVIEGGNGRGKTSVLKAIRAALAAQGVSADAIRKGADAAEILLMIDDITVRRAITARGGKSLTVTMPNGERKTSPQEFLSALLGISPLDPIDLFLEKDSKKRRARILQAMPVAISAELLQQWLPPGTTPAQILGPDGLAGHGLEVVARAHQVIYQQRTGANADAKTFEQELQTALARVANAKQGLERFGAGDAPAIEEADLLVAAAGELLGELLESEKAATAAAARGAETAGKVHALRRDAVTVRGVAAAESPCPNEETEARESLVATTEAHGKFIAAIGDLEQKLAHARLQERAAAQVVKEAGETLAALGRRRESAAAKLAEADALDARAVELAAAGGLAGERPDAAQLDEAREQVREANELRAFAIAKAAWLQEVEKAEATRHLHARAEERATALDASVKALSTDAPRALLKASSSIEGLTLDGDDVLLDGVSLDRISGAEQLRFAVEIARRLNAKAKLLIVDGLERIDDDERRSFYEMATAGGYQLISTRVTSGAAVVHPIEGA